MSDLQKTISPVDGSVYVERELASPAQIDAAIQQAVEAQKGWSQTAIAERASLQGARGLASRTQGCTG